MKRIFVTNRSYFRFRPYPSGQGTVGPLVLHEDSSRARLLSMRWHRSPGTQNRATLKWCGVAGAVARIQSRAHRGYRSNLSLSVLRRICHRPNSPPPASIRLFITALETCRFLGTLCLPCIVFWRSRARRHARRQSSHPMGHISDMRGEIRSCVRTARTPRKRYRSE